MQKRHLIKNKNIFFPNISQYVSTGIILDTFLQTKLPPPIVLPPPIFNEIRFVFYKLHIKGHLACLDIHHDLFPELVDINT